MLEPIYFLRRLVGQWRDTGEVFLIRLGESKRELFEEATDALEEYTLEDLRRIKAVTYEQYYYDPFSRIGQWMYDGDFEIRRIKYLVAARERDVISWEG